MNTVGFITKNVIGFINKFLKDNVTVYAAQSSFFIIISAIPFALMLISCARMAIPFESYTLIAMIEPYIPYKFIATIEYLIQEAWEKSYSFKMLSFSAITLIWSASKGFRSLGLGICRIYNEKPSGFIKSYIEYMIYTFVFALVFIAVITFLLFAPLLAVFNIILKGPYLTIVALILFFNIIYYVASRRKYSFMKNIIGASAAAGGWFIFSYFFGIYIERFVDYSYIYGSLGAVVMFMVWLYICMNIVLLGAEINVWIFDKQWLNINKK